MFNRKSKWSQPGSPLTIHAMILPPSVRSFGDAIRQVDAQSIIKGDFVLVSGDMVCNVRIDDIVKVHKERRKVDKEVIMTMLVKEAAVNHRTRFAAISYLYLVSLRCILVLSLRLLT